MNADTPLLLRERPLTDGGGGADAHDLREGRRRIVFAGGLFAIVAGLGVATVLTGGSHRGGGASSSLVEEANPLSFSLQNSYGDVIGKEYHFVDETRFAEPQRETTIMIKGDDFVSCRWSIALSSDGGGGVYDDLVGVEKAATWRPEGLTTSLPDSSENDKGNNAHTFTATFPSPGTYALTATCEKSDATTVARTDSVSVFYVRRELRKLSDADRDAFLDGFLVMTRVSTAAGVEKYGKHYRSLQDFEQMHLKASGGQRLDKIHDGVGVITQHLSLTAEFELSLQSITPNLAVPYWDYTVDSVEIASNFGKLSISELFGGKHGEGSKLFTKTWFGATDDKIHTVTEGRFAYLEVPKSYEFEVRSPYGFLRAPWNINPSKYVTRYHEICGVDPMDRAFAAASDWALDLNWPTCNLHFKYSQGDADAVNAWDSWAWDLSYLPHGPVHAWLGGIGGQCSTFDALADNGYVSSEEATILKHSSFALLKNAYRNHVIEMPTYCSADSGVEDCMWKCTEAVHPWRNGDFSSYAGQAGIKSLYEMANLTLGKDWEAEEQGGRLSKIVNKVVCDTPYWPGDHLEAASPIEASFWPIHPTLDRLLQYKDMVKPFTTKEWAAEGDDVCVYYERPVADPDDDGVETNCEGHHAYDLTFWRTVSYDSATGAYVKSYLTNQELRNKILPSTEAYGMPYIYDNFLWEHCDSVGVHFKKI